MANKFIDQNGLRYFFSKIKRMLEDKADKGSLKPVATSGNYSDLSIKPTVEKSISANSSDDNVPSSKCVYAELQKIFGGKTVVFSDQAPTVDDDNIITFVKRNG